MPSAIQETSSLWGENHDLARATAWNKELELFDGLFGILESSGIGVSEVKGQMLHSQFFPVIPLGAAPFTSHTLRKTSMRARVSKEHESRGGECFVGLEEYLPLGLC